MQYTVENASDKAKAYCDKHPGWQRICDIEDSDSLSLKFKELPVRVQASWEAYYPSDPEGAWEEFGCGVSRHPFKFICGAGGVYSNVLDVPLGHQSMMIFNTSRTRKNGYSYR